MHELIEYFLFILEFMLAKSLKNECVRSKAYLIFMFIQTALRPKLFNSWEFRFSDLNFYRVKFISNLKPIRIHAPKL